MKRPLARAAMAIAAAGICFVALATPASATKYAVTLTNDYIKVGNETFDIPGVGNCPDPTIEVEILGTPPGPPHATVEVTDLSATGSGSAGGVDFVAVMSLFDFPNYSVKGTVTNNGSGADPYTGLEVGVEVALYEDSAEGACDPQEPLCSAATIVLLSGAIDANWGAPTGFTAAGFDTTGGLQATSECPVALAGALINQTVEANLVGTVP